jgi:hypothetical protein
MIAIHGIQSHEAFSWWPLVSKWCEQALEYAGNLLTLDDVKEAVANRDMQLWVICEDENAMAVCVTEIRSWPRTKVLTAIIVGGAGMEHWVGALDEVLVQFARAQGCRVLDAHGRRGWLKSLSALGWKDMTVTYAKEIHHE